LADIDPHYFGSRVHERILRCLIGAATGDQDIHIRFVFSIGLKDPVRVAGVAPIPPVDPPRLEILDRQRVCPLFVLARDDIGARIAHLW
jgi:hypothetical protein